MNRVDTTQIVVGVTLNQINFRQDRSPWLIECVEVQAAHDVKSVPCFAVIFPCENKTKCRVISRARKKGH